MFFSIRRWWQVGSTLWRSQKSSVKCLLIYRFTFSFTLFFCQAIYLHYKSIRNFTIQLALHASVSLYVPSRQEYTSFSRSCHVLPPWTSQIHIELWLTSSSNNLILIKRRMKFLDILHYFNFQGVSYVKDNHFKVINSCWSIHTHSHRCASFTFLLATSIPGNVVVVFRCSPRVQREASWHNYKDRVKPVCSYHYQYSRY